MNVTIQALTRVTFGLSMLTPDNTGGRKKGTMGLSQSGFGSRWFDASPRWLRLSLVESAVATVITGLMAGFGFLTPDITPVTMILHFFWAIAISSWVVSLRVRMPGEQKAILGVGVAFAVGSCWALVQQWLGYFSSGLLNDPLMVVATMVMDGLGGGVTYILHQFNNNSRPKRN